MSKKRKFELVDCSAELAAPTPINWQKCVICQEENGQALITATETGLRSLSESILKFHELSALPRSVPFSELNKCNDVSNSLITNKAKYHKDCRSKLNKQKLERQEKSSKSTGGPSDRSTFCTRSKVTHDIKSLCLFCDEDDSHDSFVHARTFKVDNSIFALATQLGDKKLLSKIASSDLVALEAKYHKLCYVRYRNVARSDQRRNSKTRLRKDMYEVIYGSSLSQTATFITDAFTVSETSYPVFRLGDLKRQIENRMKNFGIAEPNVYRTKLKEDLLFSVPGLSECKQGKNIFLYFKKSTGQALRDAINYGNASDDGMCLANAAKIIRKDLFQKFPLFAGSFTDEFQAKNCVSETLILLLQMILEDSNVEKDQIDEDNAALSIAQLIRFNAVKYKRKCTENTEKKCKQRHSVEQETPLPVYIGLKLYSSVRSKNLIQSLHALGLSISYDRVHTILSTTTNIVCESYEISNCVLPPSLHRNTFTSAVIDNVDHNQSSTTASTSFHGTSITLIQHPDAPMTEKPAFKIENSHWNRSLCKDLPDFYTTISPLQMPKYCDVPMSNIATPVDDSETYSLAVKAWLIAIEKSAEFANTLPDEKLSWSAFTSENYNESQIVISNHVLLPLLNEKVQTPAVIAHCLKTIGNIFKSLSLNSGVPVVTGDQPIYAIAKQLQWKYPAFFGEDKFVIMLGGLHIEMAIMSLIGAWLTGSGWTDILVDAGVASTGQAESFLSCSHVKRTRYAHQVTVAALTILKNKAFENSNNEAGLEFGEWCEIQKKDSAQFLFWSLTMDLEVLLLSYVQSVREGDFIKFRKVLEQVCPWMFALDRTNYARWLPVFVNTLKEIEFTHPSVYEEFMRGKFVSQKTNRSFSAIADDQLHEQNNRKIKEIGGAIGLLDNPSALLKWMVGGPQVSKMISDFEKHFSFPQDEETDDFDEATYKNHRENTVAFEKRFVKSVLNVVTSFQKYGNPFEAEKLSTAVSNICMSTESEQSVKDAEEKGKSSYEAFVQERFVQVKTSIHSVIKRTNLSLFSDKKVATKNTKQQLQIKNLRKDANVFCRLYVASQSRSADISNIFAHENHAYPPSISEFGKLRKPPKKSEIVNCLTTSGGKMDEPIQYTKTSCTANVIDGAALVHTLSISSVKTFSEFSIKVFQPAIQHRLQNFNRVDIVFDRYLPGSIKEDTRQKRGSGKQMIVKGHTPLPKNFGQFLMVDHNKIQLFQLLAKDLESMETMGKTVICTNEEMISCAGGPVSSEDLAPCLHEEADTRLFVHIRSAVLSGHEYILLNTVDSDVVVLATAVFRKLKSLGLRDLMIEYGVGQNKSLISISKLTEKIAPEICDALPFFHAYTGCDTVSAFHGVGKLKAWNVWKKMKGELTDTFTKLSSCSEISEDDFQNIQLFTIYSYDASSEAKTVNECRRILYTQKNRSIECIPPTEEALRQHLRRAMLQSCIWRLCLELDPQIPEAKMWGWKTASSTSDGKAIEPLWTILPEASVECSELIRCGCKTMCMKNCKCHRFNLKCTALCLCDGQCA